MMPDAGGRTVSTYLTPAPGVSVGAWKPRTATCDDCKAEFKAFAPSQVRCPVCAAAALERGLIRAKAKAKARKQRQREERGPCVRIREPKMPRFRG